MLRHLLFVIAILAHAPTVAQAAPATPATTEAACAVTSGADDDGTLPEGVIAGVVPGGPGTPDAPLPVDPDDYYGEDGLYITLGPPDALVRRIPSDSVLVSDTGAISEKFVWYRQGNAEGELSISVQPADGRTHPTEPEVSIPGGYGTSGVQASGIAFPGPGCWEITGASGGVTITVIIQLDIVTPTGDDQG
jgi:hypothetical protein